jgi:glycosyltransferase involved in cell wall biosynthesis
MELKDINRRLSQINYRIETIKKILEIDETDEIIEHDPNLEIPELMLEENLETYNKLRDELSDKNFEKQVKNFILNVPQSNGSSYFKKLKITIGIIADEFLFKSYKDTAEFIYIHPQNYKKYVNQIDLLLVVSAWKGLSNEWVGLGNPKNKSMRNKIFEVIDFYKSNNVKTIFYSKEDPTNYQYFVDIADKCDYIFTTAVEKIPQYKKDCNNENVFLLEFGFNPVYNNPIGLHSLKYILDKNIDPNKEALFAGSWYKKYPKRQSDTKMLFDGIIDSKINLKIIDRNYYRNSENYLFPVKYLKYVSPSMDHDLLQSLTKLYTWSINLNSVQDSLTMFASRIYELQAMGNVIISNYSLGVNNLFPNVFLIFNQDEIKRIINNLTEKELYMHQIFGVRKVLREHTTYHRLSELLSKVGIKSFEIKNKKVAVVYRNKSEKITENFERQTYQNKYLMSLAELKENYYEYDYITFFTDKYEYGEFYLEDMVNGFKYTQSDYITKDSYYDGERKIQGVENHYTNHINDCNRTMFSTKAFEYGDLENILDKSSLNIENGYSIDSLELNLTKDVMFKKVSEPKFSVIIPAYNNGDHLYGKCFMSLRRSSMFSEMEIIIVDDGSTDDYTPKIIKRLERQYSNVKTFFFEDGGSGSASRPRNKGISLSTTEYITFLDPDNEAINDGYTKLYQTLSKSKELDVVIGNIIKADNKVRDVNYYQDIKNKFGFKTEFQNDEVEEYLIETSFKVQSIQAMMIRKELLLKKNIYMVEGALGEDTLYFFQILKNANNFTVINELIHVYYAGVEGSSVNNITANTFKKYLIIEYEKIDFLKKSDLLYGYLALRFNYYFKNWYLKKLKLVKEEDLDQSKCILYKIYKLYEPYITDELKEPDITKFIEDIMEDRSKKFD